jgi:electron transfer flavoprotein beta subunit
MNIIVTVKQVPDTQNIIGDAMKPDGTVNRASLPAIFNPEDLNALEIALSLKDKFGGTVTVITMGPNSAIKVLKDAIFRGADSGVLISDRRFAGADTLATSYILKLAIEKMAKYDLIVCGRQAIDGDTAQVGPQIAEKLKLNQISAVTNLILEQTDEKMITLERKSDIGHELVQAAYPLLLTVTKDANTPRFYSAKRLMAYKNLTTDFSDSYIGESPSSLITEWNLESIGADEKRCGLSGSPTKVKEIQSVILTTSNTWNVECNYDAIKDLITNLRQEHILG